MRLIGPFFATAVAAGLLVLALVLGAGDEEPRSPGAAAPAGGGAAQAKTTAAPGADAAPAVRAAAGRMDTEARVAQLFLVPSGGTLPRREAWGGVLVGGAAPPARLRRAARRARPVRTLLASAALPPQPALGGARASRVVAAYRKAGRSLRRAGVHLAVGLSADVAVLAGAMAERSFGDDPRVVRRSLQAALAGLARARMPVAVAHFPGQGAITQDPLDGPANVGLSPAELQARDLGVFAAVADRVAAVTVSSAVFTAFDPVTPASLSPRVVADELRKRLGFDGVAMTDDLSGVVAVTGGRAGGTAGAAAVDALRAGIDVVRVADEAQAVEAHRAIVAALRAGKLPVSRIDEALGRMLELKRQAGLL